MPHIVVKLWPGKTKAQKQQLADAIAKDVTGILGYGDGAVSVAFEEVPSIDWTRQVFEPDILGKWDQLAKKPG